MDVQHHEMRKYWISQIRSMRRNLAAVAKTQHGFVEVALAKSFSRLIDEAKQYDDPSSKIVASTMLDKIDNSYSTDHSGWSLPSTIQVCDGMLAKMGASTIADEELRACIQEHLAGSHFLITRNGAIVGLITILLAVVGVSWGSVRVALNSNAATQARNDAAWISSERERIQSDPVDGQLADAWRAMGFMSFAIRNIAGDASELRGDEEVKNKLQRRRAESIWVQKTIPRLGEAYDSWVHVERMALNDPAFIKEMTNFAWDQTLSHKQREREHLVEEAHSLSSSHQPQEESK